MLRCGVLYQVGHPWGQRLQIVWKIAMGSHGEVHGAAIEQYGGTYEQLWGNLVENHETSMGIL